jgi:uncharacterized membrane protein
MSRNRNKPVLGIALALLVILLVAIPVLARSNVLFDLPWWTVDAGGGVVSGGVYRLAGTSGQAEAGRASGGAYELTGGYWAASPANAIYLPLVLRGNSGLNSVNE